MAADGYKDLCRSLKQKVLPDIGCHLRSDQFNPRMNRGFMKSGFKNNTDYMHSYWEGRLDRSNSQIPYFCPRQWTRLGIKVPESVLPWIDSAAVMYHGTKPQTIPKILAQGFKTKTCIEAHGHGAYFSPSIVYSQHPRYATPAYSKALIHDSGTPGCDVIQLVLEVRLKSYTKPHVKGETMYVEGKHHIDPNFPSDNSNMEYIFQSKKPFVGPADGVVVTGIMVHYWNLGLLAVAEIYGNEWWFEFIVGCYGHIFSFVKSNKGFIEGPRGELKVVVHPHSSSLPAEHYKVDGLGCDMSVFLTYIYVQNKDHKDLDWIQKNAELINLGDKLREIRRANGVIP